MKRRVDSEQRNRRAWSWRFGTSEGEGTGCNRPPNPKEMLISDTAFDGSELACLKVARHYFLSFAVPETQAWMCAPSEAEGIAPNLSGPDMACLVMNLLNAIRRSRVSFFTYANPQCPGCSRIITEHENRMISALAALRLGQRQRAQTQMMLLCEGNATDIVMFHLEEMAHALPEANKCAVH